MAVTWTSKLNRYVHKEGLELRKMTLGMEIILHNIPKLVLMVSVAALLGILLHTVITWFAFACIRRYASGLHASNGITCTLMTLLMFVAAPFALQVTYVDISVAVLLLMFALIGFALYLYAPADTAARPILGEKKRARLKKKTVTSSIIVLALTLVFLDEAFYGHVVLGASYVVLTVLPLAYRILGRSMNNYEQYE
jgi:accessory gene regulator B